MRRLFILILLAAMVSTACAGPAVQTPVAALTVTSPPAAGTAIAVTPSITATATLNPVTPTVEATPLAPRVTAATVAATTQPNHQEGIVADSASGKPVARAWVYVGDAITRTDDVGRYSFTTSDPGTTLTVMVPGFAKFTAPATTVTSSISLVPFAARAVYMPFGQSDQQAQRDRIFDLINRTDLNAVVIDVKSDDGFVWRSDVPLARQVGASSDDLDLRGFVAAAHQRGIYVIGRFTVFKDTVLARARPDLAIHAIGGGLWRDPPGNAYADPFVLTTWQYYADLASNMADQGLDEIQYDYVRFPVDGDMRTVQYHSPADVHTRPAQITQFVTYMEQRLRPHKVFISADIFGRVVWHPTDPDTGQILEQIAPHVDYISPMLYPSGFNAGSGGFDRPPEHPYEIIKQSLEQSNARVRGLPVRVRPWLQAFQDYAWGIPYGLPQYLAQRRASEEMGSAGWMYWNPLGRYDERTFLPRH